MLTSSAFVIPIFDTNSPPKMHMNAMNTYPAAAVAFAYHGVARPPAPSALSALYIPGAQKNTPPTTQILRARARLRRRARRCGKEGCDALE